MLILILIHCSVENQAPTDPTFSENGVRIFIVHRLLHGKKTPSPLLNRIEQCFVAHVVHTCQQY
jgi:hypothetical protein